MARATDLMRHSAAVRRGTSGRGSIPLASGSRRIDPALPFHPVLWGRSMGAAIALRTAAAEPGLAALVLESPMVDLDVSMALVLRRRRIPFPKLMARLVTRRAGKLAGVPIHSPRPIDSARAGRLSHLDPPRNQRHGRLDRRSTPPRRRLPRRPAGSKSPTRGTPTSSIKAAKSCSIRSRRFWMRRRAALLRCRPKVRWQRVDCFNLPSPPATETRRGQDRHALRRRDPTTGRKRAPCGAGCGSSGSWPRWPHRARRTRHRGR